MPFLGVAGGRGYSFGFISPIRRVAPRQNLYWRARLDLADLAEVWIVVVKTARACTRAGRRTLSVRMSVFSQPSIYIDTPPNLHRVYAY